nr:MAG TPA: hypothetical protein [Caudoviricetes sp.]
MAGYAGKNYRGFFPCYRPAFGRNYLDHSWGCRRCSRGMGNR